MIPKDCKRLAEVDFPIAEVSRHAAREKSIRHGHPSTLHLWWARRPLASSRAVLLALLWPDPCDPLCPDGFKAEARRRLREVPGGNPGGTDEELRRALLRFIADFANWDNAANRTYLDVSRALVRAAHAPEDGGAYEPPLVVDPFAGGGSIPLEALRVGCDAFASDLNPVACLILKVMLEDIPRHGPALADELRRVGAEIKREAERELAELYPADPDGATPIAYLWARTVVCEAPNCGAEIPLVRSFWLCKKANRRRALRHRVERPAAGPPRVEFEVFEPRSDRDVPGGTVTRAKATCVCCGAVLPPERARTQLAAQRGGADVVFDESGQRTGGARLLAVVTLRPAETGRHYRLRTERDYQAVRKAQGNVAALLDDWERGGRQELCPVPDEPINPIRPSPNARGLSAVTRYGAATFRDLFNARQAYFLRTLAAMVALQPEGFSSAALALLIGKQADYSSAQVTWVPGGEFVRNTFSRQALSMTWDFAEAVPFSDSAGNLLGSLEWIVRVIEATPSIQSCQVQQADAAEHPLPSESGAIWFTDPPYYDAIPYADLSDYFLVWLRRAARQRWGSFMLDTTGLLSPKETEIVWNMGHQYAGAPKTSKFFEHAIGRAFAEGRRILNQGAAAAIVFAHQSTDGWEAMIGGMIGGGLTVTASWPIATERAARTRAVDNASLATSIHLICRPRPENAPAGDWAAVLRQLPKRVSDWMQHLQAEGVRGADLIFACIGPALEVFSRYSRVESAEGAEVALEEYLEKLWETVGRVALRQVLGTDSPTDFGEDARLTALFLWTLRADDNGSRESVSAHEDDAVAEDESNTDDDPAGSTNRTRLKGRYTLPHDIVRRIAQPLGIRLERWAGNLIEFNKGIVSLRTITERAPGLVELGVAHDLALISSERKAKLASQLHLFDDADDSARRRQRAAARARVEKATWSQLHLDSITTLDHVHKAMLFQRQGSTAALRELLFYEKHYRPEFVLLANALSALYPTGSEEKRLLDAMLLAVPK